MKMIPYIRHQHKIMMDTWIIEGLSYFWDCRTSCQFPNWNFVRLGSLVLKCPGCCTDVMGSIPLTRHLWQATFGARAALVALLSKMCWSCLSSKAFLPDSTEKPYSIINLKSWIKSQDRQIQCRKDQMQVSNVPMLIIGYGVTVQHCSYGQSLFYF